MSWAGSRPLTAKHPKSVSLVRTIAVGVHRMQRNFEPMRKQVETWRQTELSNVTAKMIIYQTFIEGDLDPRSTWGGAFTTATSSPRMRNSNRAPCEPFERLHVRVQGARPDSAV